MFLFQLLTLIPVVVLVVFFPWVLLLLVPVVVAQLYIIAKRK